VATRERQKPFVGVKLGPAFIGRHRQRDLVQREEPYAPAGRRELTIGFAHVHDSLGARLDLASRNVHAPVQIDARDLVALHHDEADAAEPFRLGGDERDRVVVAHVDFRIEGAGWLAGLGVAGDLVGLGLSGLLDQSPDDPLLFAFEDRRNEQRRVEGRECRLVWTGVHRKRFLPL
jgi:hypothetical protein